jgi:O-antigen/teichoic acid export membrane protein
MEQREQTEEAIPPRVTSTVNGNEEKVGKCEPLRHGGYFTVGTEQTKTVDPFDTAYLMNDLKGRSVRGGVVTLFSQACKFGLQMGSTVVLARLLRPEDFGLVAMVTVCTTFAMAFKDLGLSTAAIQRPRINHGQISTLFWINVAIGLTIAVAVIALAPLIAWFYKEPRLIPVTIGLSVAFVFGGLTVQHQALLRRRMQFYTMGIIEIIAMAAGVTAAVIASAVGAGYWSLVLLHVIPSVVLAVGTWIKMPWRPGWPRRGAGVREMLCFGGNVSAASVLNHFGSSVDRVLIGRFWGATVLGFYSKAFSMLTLPLAQMNPPIAAVALPAMSRLVERPECYRKSYLSVLEKLASISAPLVAWMIVCSNWLCDLLLGPQWAPAASVFSVLGYAGLLLPVWNSTGWVFMSQGRAKDHLRFHMLDSVCKVVSVVAGLRWGGIGVAVGVAVRYYLMMPVLFYMVGRSGPIRAGDFYHALRYPAILTVVAFVSMHICKWFLGNIRASFGALLTFAVMVTAVLVCMAVTSHGRAEFAVLCRMCRAFKKTKSGL